MTDTQWNQLLAVIRGERVSPRPVGFIIDCPWLPGWQGIETGQYLCSENAWFDSNRKAIEEFPHVWFLPGFWSEYGMCTEPSAYGARCRIYANEFPWADRVITDPAQIANLLEPDPSTDGLLPLVLRRLIWAQPKIESLGHKIRFSVSRGPLNIASFLMGTTEFLMALKTDPEPVHQLLRNITAFLGKWHQLQRSTFPSIDGILMLDDIVGFLGEEDFLEFGAPYFRELYSADVKVKFFHNDAPCAKSIRHYADLGINLYNPGVQTTLTEMRRLSADRLTILGNIPPRDVLAKGSPKDVRAAVKKLIEEAGDAPRLILSCAGGMPPGVSSENLRAFLSAAWE